MATTVYYNGRDGDEFGSAEIHTDRECADGSGDGSARPIAGFTPEESQLCPECAGGDETQAERDISELIDMGVCPWCPKEDRYEGDHVGRHASSAHPDEWDAYASDD